MRTIQRDISLTLFIKVLLLIILWVVCFRGHKHPHVDGPTWLLGASDASVNQLQG